MSNVTYVAPNRTDAGAVPRGTIIESELQPDGSNRQVVKVPNVVTMTREDNLYNDAFQRLRTSDTDQRFDGDFSYDLFAWFMFMRQPYESK